MKSWLLLIPAIGTVVAAMTVPNGLFVLVGFLAFLVAAAVAFEKIFVPKK